MNDEHAGSERPQHVIDWPEGKKFAFTVFDDTDLATVDNVAPVYEFLKDHGFRTTKSVWPLRGQHPSKYDGSTCAETEYREWVLNLKRTGFEIGLHNTTHHSSTHQECAEGIERFNMYFGCAPRVHANHSGCADGLYWGPDRFTGINRLVYTILTKGTRNNFYQGHIESSPYFWGNLCQEHIRYVRDFVFTGINTLKECPYMPYHDKRRPYVNRWFASTEGANVDLFAGAVSEEHQDRLEQEGGACIMYTHFACGFYRDGALDPRFMRLMERLGKKNGWFVPVSVMLDHIAAINGVTEITPRQRRQVERKFLWNRTALRFTRYDFS